VTNTLVKVAIAWVSGGRRFARGLAIGLGVAVAGGLALAVIASL